VQRQQQRGQQHFARQRPAAAAEAEAARAATARRAVAGRQAAQWWRLLRVLGAHDEPALGFAARGRLKAQRLSSNTQK
jgi:hypothetical protein